METFEDLFGGFQFGVVSRAPFCNVVESVGHDKTISFVLEQANVDVLSLDHVESWWSNLTGLARSWLENMS
jgi:hypothetical protein